MKIFVNIILALLTIVIAILATVFTVSGVANLNSFDGVISIAATGLLVVGVVKMLSFYNPFAELWKAFNLQVASATLWGNRANVPPVVYGNVDLKEDKQMKKLEEMETQIAALKDQIKTLEGSEAFYKSTTRNWQNTSRRKDAEIKELKNQLHAANMDCAKMGMKVNELVRELNGEKRGAMDMISSLMTQVKRLTELNRELNEEIKMSRIIKAEPPVVKNDNPYYNEDWKLVRDAERTIFMFQPKTAEHKQDKEDLTAKVSVARMYADGKMGKQGIPSDLRDSIKSLMELVRIIMG